MKLFKFHQKHLDIHLEYRILFTTLVLLCFVLKKKKKEVFKTMSVANFSWKDSNWKLPF